MLSSWCYDYLRKSLVISKSVIVEHFRYTSTPVPLAISPSTRYQREKAYDLCHLFRSEPCTSARKPPLCMIGSSSASLPTRDRVSGSLTLSGISIVALVDHIRRGRVTGPVLVSGLVRECGILA